jgi:hypothetical protein
VRSCIFFRRTNTWQLGVAVPMVCIYPIL